MKVVVCVKRVPSTTARVKVGADGRSIDETGVEFVLNPYDEFAVEEALRVVEKQGGEATVVCLGPEAAAKELRGCLATGVHNAVHLVAPAGPRDALATAKTLAEAVKAAGAELVLFGRQAVDDDQAQVGLMVATLLGMPAVCDVVRVELASGRVKAQREVEGAVETVELTLPCVLTCNKGLNEPRLPNMKGIMAAKKKTIAAQPASAAVVTLAVESLELPPERAAGRIVGEGAAAVPALLKALRDEAHAI
jgi:electron transfer flavoprotein beta subunit